MEQQKREIEKERQNEEFKCLICLNVFDDERNVYPLSNCEHVFHKDCLNEYIKAKIDTGSIPIKCLALKCDKEIVEEDLKQLINKQLKDKYHTIYLNKTMDLQPDISWCPNAACNYAFFFEEGANSFKCEVCQKHYCLNCRVPYHRG